MAKAGFWLRGAKGKLAGSVLAKGEFGTIQRELVTPSNPKTAKQMRTRMVFSVVSKAASALTDLIGISFAGETKITKAKRRFRALNMSMLIEKAKSNAASVTYAPKGFSILIPNEYIVAQGSQTNATLGDVYLNAQSDGFISGTHSFQLELNKAYTPEQILNIIFGCKPGDQITTVAIHEGTPINTYPEALQILRFGDMRSARVVFKSDAVLASVPNLTLTLADGASLNTIAQQIQDYLVQLFDIPFCNNNFFQLLTISDGYTPERVAGSDTLLQFGWDVETASGEAYPSLAYLTGEHCMAFGYFRSHYNDNSGMWDFSRCQLERIDPVYSQVSFDNDDNINYGVDLALALRSYQASSEGSDRYTEAGGSDNDINF